MKKTTLITILIALMLSCSSNADKQAGTESAPEVVEEVPIETQDDLFSKREYAGTYKGTAVDIDGNLLDVTITLGDINENDACYTLSYKNKKGGTLAKTKGTYSFTEETFSVIKLEKNKAGLPSEFLVIPDAIIQMIDGETVIDGEGEVKYSLTKR